MWGRPVPVVNAALSAIRTWHGALQIRMKGLKID